MIFKIYSVNWITVLFILYLCISWKWSGHKQLLEFIIIELWFLTFCYVLFFCRLAPVECGTGTYSLSLATKCTACPAGFECSVTDASPVACEPGYYSSGSQTACTACPLGQACPSTIDPTQAFSCLAGKFVCLSVFINFCLCGPECRLSDGSSLSVNHKV